MMFEFRAQSLEISSSNKGLYFTCISHISPNIVQSSLNLLLQRADENALRKTESKTEVTKAIRGEGVFWVLRLTFHLEICQAPINDQS